MIAHLKGKIDRISQNFLDLDVNGIGYGVFMPGRVLKNLKINQDIKLFIYTYVRENEISLYGFDNLLDKEFFKKLISISGIGPKLALAILSVYEPINLAKIILNKNLDSLIKVSGVGSKTAQRIILELQEKIGLIVPQEKIEISSNSFDEVMEILVTLGCNSKEASEVINKVKKINNKDLEFNELITESLKVLGEN